MTDWELHHYEDFADDCEHPVEGSVTGNPKLVSCPWCLRKLREIDS